MLAPVGRQPDEGGRRCEHFRSPQSTATGISSEPDDCGSAWPPRRGRHARRATSHQSVLVRRRRWVASGRSGSRGAAAPAARRAPLSLGTSSSSWLTPPTAKSPGSSRALSAHQPGRLPSGVRQVYQRPPSPVSDGTDRRHWYCDAAAKAGNQLSAPTAGSPWDRVTGRRRLPGPHPRHIVKGRFQTEAETRGGFSWMSGI